MNDTLKALTLSKTEAKAYFAENTRKQKDLLATIRERHDDLKVLLKKVDDHWGCEDLVYRFYHHSYKVHYAADLAEEVFDALTRLAPWGLKRAPDALKRIRRIGKVSGRREIERLFHARYFLEMAVKYGKKYKHPPSLMPSGYAALIYLYGLR